MPRQKESKPRSRWLSVRLTADEAAMLRQRAKRAGVSVSRYGRVTLLGTDMPEINPEAPASSPGEDEARRLLAEQVRRVGVNLNQVAKQLNASGLNSPRELVDLMADIRSYVDRARQL